jgi:FG-GAP-like repeat
MRGFPRITLYLLLVGLTVFATIALAASATTIYLPLVSGAPEIGEILAPVLKWQHGGCYSSWCETGWYSSPAVADLDGDGSVEVIGSAYSIFVLNGKTGAQKWQVASGHDRSEPGADVVGRTWPGIVIADVDGDSQVEIVTAHSGGVLSVYERDGYFAPGWPKQPTSLELRGLSISDLDQDGTFEIIATGAVYGKVNTWVYEHDGTSRPGWPQLSNDSGYAYGIFNTNAAAGDLDGDGFGELVVPSDVHYINAFERDGGQIPANAKYGGKGWGLVGVWESPEIELRGWGTCDSSDPRAERYRSNFAHGPAAIADMDGDGKREVIVTGNVYDCGFGSYPSRYIGVFIFNADRSRFNKGGFNWTTGPIDTGTPLSEDYNQIESAQPNPAIADLDGDGLEEILFASYDGRMHAFWLDKTEHGSWPYSVNQPGEGFYRFASEPVVADLNGDGRAEVIFASWAEKDTGATGQLHMLDYLGNPLYEVDLPVAFSGTWNGALAAPTLANIDGDADFEVVLNTAHSGIVAYDLPGTSGATILWGTGRGNTCRDGYVP